MNNEEYERNLLWMENRIRQLEECDSLFSPVSNFDRKGTEKVMGVLKFEQGKLCLEDAIGVCFRVKLQDVKNAVFDKHGVHIRLTIEVDHQRYLMAFLSIESEKNADERTLKGAFGETAFGLLLSLARIVAHKKPLMRANFDEAEKWRDVFPDAEFPNTKIKNA